MNGILALGNPGTKYQNTRHNAGFLAADALCNAFQGRWKKSFLRPLLFAEFPERNCVLLKPLTYMNRSGSVLPYVMQRWGIQPDNVLLLVDNLDLPCGKIRFKSKGSTAGHNGIKSIARVTGTTNFARLYLGIGRPDVESESGQNPVVEHVLGAFTDQEMLAFQSTLSVVVNGCSKWLESGSAAAAELVNGHYARTDYGS